MIHAQTYTCQLDWSLNHTNIHIRTLSNERYMDFLLFALHRIIETALLYETQAKKCRTSINKLFLYYLAGKKRVQHVVLEMIATSNRGKPLALPNYNSMKSLPEIMTNESLSDASPEYIFNYAKRRATKDLDLYLSLTTLEEDVYTKKLLSTLSKLSKDFIQDISAGYAKFTSNNQIFPNNL
jgi:hypothetical protein